jgi:hypothetical protein
MKKMKKKKNILTEIVKVGVQPKKQIYSSKDKGSTSGCTGMHTIALMRSFIIFMNLALSCRNSMESGNGVSE